MSGDDDDNDDDDDDDDDDGDDDFVPTCEVYEPLVAVGCAELTASVCDSCQGAMAAYAECVFEDLAQQQSGIDCDFECAVEDGAAAATVAVSAVLASLAAFLLL